MSQPSNPSGALFLAVLLSSLLTLHALVNTLASNAPNQLTACASSSQTGAVCLVGP